jgi:hypothetical protein
LLLSAVSAVILGLAAHLLDRLLEASGMSSSAETALNDVVIGALGGLAVFLAWERARRYRIQERLTLVAELNHHVRNALTTIVLSAEHPDLKKRLQRTFEAVDRIEWVLRELVPTAAFHKGKPRLLGKES